MAQRLASRVDWRAAEPLNYIPSLFFKYSVQLASRRAAEPQNYIPSSFFEQSVQLVGRQATKLYTFLVL